MENARSAAEGIAASECSLKEYLLPLERPVLDFQRIPGASDETLVGRTVSDGRYRVVRTKE